MPLEILVELPEAPAPGPQADPCEWLIDHMPLLDRFGFALRLEFLKSTDPNVVALRLDYFGRKWLDLRHPELKAGFYYMAGVTVPVLGTIATPIAGLTQATVDAKFADPALATENEALRKTFFK